MSTKEKSSIGLQRIWSEGQGVEKISLFARVIHVSRRALENLRRSRITSSLTVVTIAVALSVLSCFALLVGNCAESVQRESGEMMVMIFLRDATSLTDVERIKGEIQDVTQGLSITYTDKGAALEAFRKMLGEDGAMLEGLEANNPLPASINVAIADPQRADQLFATISDRLAGSLGIDSIRYSRSGVQQLKKVLRIVEIGGSVGMCFLLVITGFIIANTIKLALYNHRMEIEIMELVGARRRSIYAPYVLEGLGQGIVGASIGIAFVFSVYVLVTNSVAKSELLQMVFPTFQFLSLSALACILGAGAVVGMGGSFLAVRRFLSEL
jgi:cell division transport system permease protein